jgi:AcrR family transcriptional regulator
VVVETLADRLGATKGGFYWHFPDREALVAPVLERVSRRWVEFLTEGFTDLGFPRPTARHRALAAYTAYVGHFQLQRAAPSCHPPARPSAATSATCSPWSAPHPGGGAPPHRVAELARAGSGGGRARGRPRRMPLA